MLKALLFVCAFAVTSSVPVQDNITPRQGETCGYESCTKTEAGVLNVHIVPHTHDDVGWLKTVDQYYYGSRNGIQKAGVQYILDSVIKELWEDSRRRFIYVETAFFWKWWVRQSDSVRHKVHTLVRQGRLQFVGGAWSMNDEAAVHYQSTIDQFTWGLSKLNDTFGHCGLPRVGWQIDPFGHSREFVSLLSAMGYDGLFLGRIDYQDKSTRKERKSMEMLWRGDDDLGKSSDIFTGVLYNTYSPPPGFCFDVLCNDEPIIDDPDSPMYNVEERISSFLKKTQEMSLVYKTNNILVTMGDDFNYGDAGMWFSNLDRLIKYSNLKAAKDGMNIKLFYSTPNCYLKAVRDANPTLPRKQDDFFPYASDSTAYWTGYFTSRPTTKYFEREGNNYLQMVKQLQVLANLEDHNMFVLNELKSAMGVMQHHDAVTGTEKEHVTHDYERLLNQAIDDALIIARQAFNKLMQQDKSEPPTLTFERCHFNESSCEISENKNKFVVTVYNPLGWNVKDAIRIPVVNNEYEVINSAGNPIPTQLLDIPNYVINIPTRKSKATHEIVFIDELPAIGFKSYYIQTKTKIKRETKFKRAHYDTDINNYWKDIKDKNIDDISYVDEKIPDRPVNNKINEKNFNNQDLNADVLKDKAERRNKVELNYHNLNEEEMRMLADDPIIVQVYNDLVLENEHIKLYTNRNGQITHAVLPDGNALNLSIKYYYYPGSAGDNRHPLNRSSGAYIFRPNATKPITVPYGKTKLIKGPIVQEIRNEMKNVGSTLKIYSGLDFFENDWVIGPIDVKDNIGKEYIVKYVTDIINNGEFYTDSNGRQLLKRKLNKRPQWNVTLQEPIPGNYYPVTNEIYIEDSKIGFAILTDRSQGGTSLIEGDIELMLHRRLLHDDAFGVDEALNETANGKGLVVRGRHRIVMSTNENKRRRHALNIQLQPLVLVSDAEDLSLDDWLKFANEYSGINELLPEGVHLLTLEPWRNKFLLRLENYQTKTEPIAIDLKKIFKKLKIKSYRETTLAANQWIDDYDKMIWNKEGEFSRSFNEEYGSFNEVPRAEDKIDVKDTDVIKIKAKQIRTFIVDYDYQ